VTAKRFMEADNMDDIAEIVTRAKDLLLIGGGSNMLLLHDIDRTVLHITSKGKKIIHKDASHVYIEVAAGENWHDFVMWCVENDYGGIENLALIPGNVGTAPIQNIGAYGVEVKDVIEEVQVLEIETIKSKNLTNTQCHFAYRDSIFKNTHKGKYIITAVVFRLTQQHHTIHDTYGALKNLPASDRNIKGIANAVIAIRSEKLPDPKEIGNSGSFFKNPMITKQLFKRLIAKHPTMPHYPVATDSGAIKLAAGWLIDQCGLKGFRQGDAGVHHKQALVLVNYGNASGMDILNLAKYVQNKVFEKFGVQLEMEVNIIES